MSGRIHGISAVWVLQAFLVFLVATSTWATTDVPQKKIVSSDTSISSDLTSLVRAYVSGDEHLSEEMLLEKILAHPSATLESVKTAVQRSRLYTKKPVGVQPHRPIVVNGQSAEFALYVPVSYTPTQSYPLIVCLHGAGFRGDSYLERWAPRLNDRYILACPTIAMGAWWTGFGERLVLAVLQTIQSDYHIDASRVFLTGMSNGGIGTWIIGMHHAARFAGIAPMASGIDDVLFPFIKNLEDTPVYVIHGKEDRIMPVRLSRDLVQEMKRLGIAHRYREHSWTHPHAGGHFFPRQELPALVEWFDSQRRGSLPRRVSIVRDGSHLLPAWWVRIDSTDRIAAFTENLIDGHDEFIVGKVYANLQAELVGSNHVSVETQRVRRYTLFFNEDLVDFSKPILVTTNGQPSFEGVLKPSITTLLREARYQGDLQTLFSVKLTLEIPAR